MGDGFAGSTLRRNVYDVGQRSEHYFRTVTDVARRAACVVPNVRCRTTTIYIRNSHILPSVR